MDRDTAYQLVCEKITQDNLIKHIISVEAVMRSWQHISEKTPNAGDWLDYCMISIMPRPLTHQSAIHSSQKNG